MTSNYHKQNSDSQQNPHEQLTPQMQQNPNERRTSYMRQNLHTHTNYCDGTLSAEDMIKAALNKGCAALGFSEHSHLDFDKDYAMSKPGTYEYVNEIKRLKEKYKGIIDIYLGLERDYLSDIEQDITFDYIIGTVHYINREICVDNGADKQQKAANTHYGGDYYSFVEAYFAAVADAVGKTKADIVGHFDLITKYNTDGILFDETHPRYVSAALGAMDAALKSCKLFEVNTGAMYRLGKTEPYPSPFLLRELCKRGGEVVLASDSHDAESICWKFDEMHKLLNECGFKYTKILTAKGFADELL